MAADFADVTIQRVDEEESYRRSGGFLETVFVLAPVPSPEWIMEFERHWDAMDFFPKRHARLEKGTLVFVCLEHELQGYPMEALREAIAKTNDALRGR